ncbi:MAG: hypothetical protein R2756_05800 [Bacteroidales bacterium]
MISYVSRFNYDYNKSTYAGFSFRRDGSSRLAPESRWGNFWSRQPHGKSPRNHSSTGLMIFSRKRNSGLA